MNSPFPSGAISIGCGTARNFSRRKRLLPFRASAGFWRRTLLGCAAALAVATAGWSATFTWQTATPESRGMSTARLDALRDHLAAHATKAFLLVSDDCIVYEWYAPDHSATKLHYSASMAKALVGGVAAAVALSDGRLELDDPAAKFVPAWRADAAKTRVTLRQLGSHTSGLEDAKEGEIPHAQLTGWKGDFWKRLPPPRDPFSISRDLTPLVSAPGERFGYSNPGIAMLGYAITAALREAPEKDLRTVLRERIMRPIGVPDAAWNVGYGQTAMVDGLPLVGAWGGGNFTARATAQVARLMLQEGNWEGRPLLRAEAVRATTNDPRTAGSGGIGWWSNHAGGVAALPRDAYWGAGAGHQTVLILPSRRLIAVRNGGVLSGAVSYDHARDALFFQPLMQAIGAATRAGPGGHGSTVKPAGPPYPRSPIIREITWAPAPTIVRRAKGSDNWPLTWADDDALYTAYGDGQGFEPFGPEKLSLGLAKVTGSPPDFQGWNLRAQDGEFRGDGRAGRKASGLLMVDGVLYLLARNLGNARLAWSRDRGSSWTWADWKFATSFGCPTFLNFGRNYAGARDGFVYVYSPDTDSAYEAADRMVLARVPKERVAEQAAYEYFVALEGSGQPRWSRDLGQRGAVFVHRGNCYRGGITYHAALRRYLWCQILPHSTHPQGMRFQGGFGIYDAPEPWGPWTTAFYTEAWDVGPGESSSLPTKWMNADGRTVHLVFSGDDSFAVRRATLQVWAEPKPQ